MLAGKVLSLYSKVVLFDRLTFLGIDPTAGEKPCTYAALDGGLKLLALGQGSLDDVLAFAAGLRQAVAVVCAPRRPNQGLMARPEVRQALNPPPAPGRWEGFRLAETLLRRKGIAIPRTPASEEAAPGWMRRGFLLFRRLEAIGYQADLDGGAERLSLEVYPHACFTALLNGVAPYPKQTLEGRLQRQLVLYEKDVQIGDPLEFLEEFTRRHLLTGKLPFEQIHTPAELDALVAAYTGWLALRYPERVERLGALEEGEIVVPLVGSGLKPGG